MALTFTPKTTRILKIRSFTDATVQYVIDLNAVSCTCKSYERTNGCKHLSAIGLHKSKPFTPKTHPTFSQALCALVKSIRIRRPLEAVYWMLYMDTYPDSLTTQRFRVARRILIGTAEDGVSIPVMEKCVDHFPVMCRLKTELLTLVAEVVRLCKTPNWWHPDSGGSQYFYDALIGERRLLYAKWDGKETTVKLYLKEAIVNQDRIGTMLWLSAFGRLGEKEEKYGPTKQAEFLLGLAGELGHGVAGRLCEVHLQAKSALSGDTNFIGQAAWCLAGGSFAGATILHPVTRGECYELIAEAQEQWKTPHPVPTWACDGIHCAGNDTRFMGMLPQMVAVCRAFTHYGRIDPADPWLPSFQCYDGLDIEVVS